MGAYWFAIASIVVGFVAISVVNLRLHNAKAERMFKELPTLEDDLSALISHISALRTQQVAMADFSSDVVALSQSKNEQELQGKLPALLADLVNLLGGQAKPRIRVLLRQGDELLPYAWFVPEGMPAFNNNPFGIAYGAVGRAFQQDQVILIPNIAEDELFREQHSSISTYQSVLCVPISVPGTVLGVLNLDSPHDGYFSQEHVVVLTTASNLLALVFSRYRQLRC